jgi:hypothetical protein
MELILHQKLPHASKGANFQGIEQGNKTKKRQAQV